MKYYPEHKRYAYFKALDDAKHMPYDFEKQGILENCLPEIITKTTNKTTNAILRFTERTFVFICKYIDELKYFKDWTRTQY